MKVFDFVVIGAGIAGALSAYFLKEFNTLLIDKEGILQKASGAAGAFLFPKVGLNTAYTRFINNAIVDSIEFYKSIGVDTHTKGVLILPRNQKDIEKFKKYEKEITLPFKKINGGFFFDIGSMINPEDVRNKLNLPFEKLKVVSLKKEDFWVINSSIKAKNVILASGYEKIVDLKYIDIKPIWGERIEVFIDNLEMEYYYHKNVSFAKVGNLFKIGATHKRDCLECKENLDEALELINKAKEIVEFDTFEIKNIKGGFRAATPDFFPVVGEVIDVDKTLKYNPRVVKGENPKKIFYKEGLYIINGMGARGFSNAYVCAKMLKDFILYKKNLNEIDTKRVFIKWARKRGEEYLRRQNVKG